MNVTHNGYRCLDMNHVALLHQQFLCLGTDGLNDRLRKELFSVEALDALIEIDAG